jgi:replicative DNA helicase
VGAVSEHTKARDQVGEELGFVQDSTTGTWWGECPSCGDNSASVGLTSLSCPSCPPVSLDRARKEFVAVSSAPSNPGELVDLFGDEWLDSYAVEQANPRVQPTSTGIDSLDKICRDQGQGKGWGPHLVCLAGNPGLGKTTLALSLISAALRQGRSVGMINLEQTNVQLATRLYSVYTGTKLRDIESGEFSKSAWDATRQKLADVPPLFAPKGILTSWESILAYAYKCHAAGCTWICLDYLQLATTGSDASIHDATVRVVTELRRFCLETECTVLMLSQWNRSGSSNYAEPPVAQNLHGGMMVEASCDLVLGLDHTRVKRVGNSGYYWLLTLKNRHGPIIDGGIPIEIDFSTLRCSEGLPSDESRWG